MPSCKRKHEGGFQSEALKDVLENIDIDGSQKAARKLVEEITIGESKDLLVSTLIKKQPIWNAVADRWQCECCKDFLKASTHLSWHDCTTQWSFSEMGTLVVLLNGKKRCRLCQQIVSENRHHSCRWKMLTLVVFDFSGTSFSPVSKGNHDHEHPLSKLREIGAHAVLVTEEANKAKPECTHVIMGPSDIAGHGLFNVQKLQLGRLIGAYTGLIKHSAADDEGGNLMTVTMKSGKIIDPTDVGGLLCLCNQGHGQKASMEIYEERIKGHRHYVPFLRASREIPSGEELLWFYNAFTDNRKDKLLKIECRCRDPQCTGKLMECLPFKRIGK